MLHWILWTIISCVLTRETLGQNECSQNTNCKLPNCFCATSKHHLPVDQIPQIVYFAFDDEIDKTIGSHYERLFHPSRKNPNGCPITMSMFATNKSTDYDAMDKLYSMGMEIGSHNTIHMTTKDIISNETRSQQNYIGQMTNIPPESIIGFRSPFLASAGDDQIEALKGNGFKYDISYTFTRRPESSLNIWPFTLDYGWPYPCNINPCPKQAHPGFWEVPINSMWDYIHTDICAYADSCTYSPPSANAMFKYLWSNFNNSYSQNKAPFGIHLHGRWLNDGLRLWAVDKFIRELLKLPDVYIISVKKMLQWMAYPAKLSELQLFEPWTCAPDAGFMPPLNPLPARCEQGVNCQLPNCVCDQLQHEMTTFEIPQMVYFAFDGPIDGTVGRYFQTLFDQSRRNPNECPIRFSLFLSHENTDYNQVQELYDNGAEIGTNGLGKNYLATKESVLNEAMKMKQNIILNTEIPDSDIKGFRSPYLSTAGDGQVEALKKAGYNYDMSYTFTRRPYNSLNAWPVTLDYGWPYICNIEPCPVKSHKGFWEVPVNSLYDWTNTDICTYADECRNQPNTEDETYQYLMDNFMNSYRGNKAPFGIHLHPRWFHIHRYLRGVNRFIKELVKKKDVYIISVSDVLEWMKDPVTLEKINKFSNWKCPAINKNALPPPALPDSLSECKNDINCRLPNCFCPTFDHPMATSDIPQIVYFAFDDEVTLKYSGYYFNLFGPSMRNPNNCSMTFTLFTINKGTDYSFIEYFYKKGNEIASHGANNIPTNSKITVLSEAGSQKQNILDNTNVTAGEVTGFRSPQLSTAGDDQLDVLEKLGYKYDASYTFTRRPKHGKNAWPFTADYGWPYDCNIPPCPFYSHKGFWMVPVNSMWDYKNESICTFADECKHQPLTEKDVFDYLWANFQNSYKGNRAPFGIHLHPMWLNSIKNIIGLRRFIDKISQLNDAYVVSIAKAIEWMKNPTKLQDIKSFRPWMCSDSNPIINQKPTTVPVPTINPIIQSNHVRSLLDQTLSSSIDQANSQDQFQLKTVGNSMTSMVTDPTMGVPIRMPLSKTPDSESVLSFAKFDRGVKPIVQNIASTKHFKNPAVSEIFQLTNTKEQTSTLKNNSQLDIGQCVQGHSCSLPFCYCKGQSVPLKLPKLATPQMVFLAFDGTLNHADHGPYLNLLENKKNPNNCSISATFFVNQKGSNVTAIKDMHDRGYEIAMRGNYVLRPSNASMLESEIADQIAELSSHGINDVVGWKTVGYTKLTDDFKYVLKKYAFLYDSTNYFDNENNLWPYTLDFGPTNSSLLWEIPNLALTDYLGVYQCQYADGCFNSPDTTNATFTFLWNNFKKHYVNGNRAPFGISMRKTWLSHPFYSKNLEGLKLFLKAILSSHDVYIVSVKNVLEWMENPLPLADIPRSNLWTCT